MPVLYEHSTSVCVIKVRLTLLEKGIDYEGRFVDLRRGDQFDPAYRKIHPGAVVPALIHDGQTILESSVIQYYLEDAFPEPSLMPADPVARYRVRLLMKTIDDPVHPATGLLTHAIAFRKDYRTPKAIEARMAKIPDPRRRARQRAVYEEGLAASSPSTRCATWRPRSRAWRTHSPAARGSAGTSIRSPTPPRPPTPTG